jgi:hypothetical protein
MFKIRFLVEVVLFLAKGIFGVFRSVQNVDELEERVQRLVQEAGAKMLEEALSHIDLQLNSERDPVLKNVGRRSRTLVTSFGEITVKRRLYRNQKTGAYRFLLDEALGIPERRRVTPRVTRLILELGTEMPFRRAARVMGFLVPGIHWMTIWSKVQDAGEKAARDAEALREAVFEDGVVPEGGKEVRELSIEADGVVIPLQRSPKNFGEIKLFVGYEGREQKTRKLVNRHTVATTKGSRVAWEEAGAAFGHKWDLGKADRIRIGGDGAEWVKQGLEMFPGATYHLDPFHLRRRLTEVLGYSAKVYSAVTEGLSDLSQDAVVLALDQAIRVNRGAHRHRIKQLKQYLLNNWEGIAALPQEDRLGAIEGQVRHTIARRTKRIGARWSLDGAERMGRLLAVRANDELDHYAAHALEPRFDVLRKAAGAEAFQLPKRFGKDPEAWLQANVPALEGPHAGRHWVKHILREIGSPRWSTV